MQSPPLFDTTIPLPLTNGNDGRGGAFWSSAKRRKEYETDLRLLRQEREPFDRPVRVVVTRVLGSRQRLWDADSVLRGSAKELVDALVAIGWFHDDGPKWIVECDGRQDATQRGNGPATRVQVFEVDSEA